MIWWLWSKLNAPIGDRLGLWNSKMIAPCGTPAFEPLKWLSYKVNRPPLDERFDTTFKILAFWSRLFWSWRKIRGCLCDTFLQQFPWRPFLGHPRKHRPGKIDLKHPKRFTNSIPATKWSDLTDSKNHWWSRQQTTAVAVRFSRWRYDHPGRPYRSSNFTI